MASAPPNPDDGKDNYESDSSDGWSEVFPMPPAHFIEEDRRFLLSNEYLESLRGETRETLLNALLEFKIAVEGLVREKWAYHNRIVRLMGIKQQLSCQNSGLAKKCSDLQKRLQEAGLSRQRESRVTQSVTIGREQVMTPVA
ncbi:hypothetical protein XA68_16006 [Ophiocordyceps unilateralis]|uniref:Uncharacterized protein n=1 Tax=Ophiocordyceps unilateralis TaxID=268505 RepID=A0A2A9PKI8_OPHUN|nr:hypothetical protein XA68_16006 [Ophiocordyceps unilateralis]